MTIFDRPNATDPQNNPSHSQIHNDEMDAINNIETGDTVLDRIQLDISPAVFGYSEGQIYWNPIDKTLNIENGDGTTTQVGQEMHTICYNDTGSTILNGQVVYISGVSGTRPKISLAKADAYATADSTLGFATMDIPTGAEGRITTSGLVHDINTNAFNAGDELYLSATTAGAYVTTQPLAPNLVVHLGHIVVKSATVGSIYVDPIVVTQTADSVTIEAGAGVVEMNNVQDFFRHAWSSGASDGFAITDNGNGTVNIASGEIVIRETDADDAVLKTYLIPATTNLAITDNEVNYLYLTYGSGTATWTTGTALSQFDGITKVIVYVIGRNGTRLNIVDLRKINVDFGRKSRRQKAEFDGFVFNGWWRSNLQNSPLTSSGLNLLVGAGKYFYFDNPITHSAFDTTVAGSADANNWIRFYNRTGNWTQVTGQKSVNNTQYDNAGTLTTMTNGRWRTDYVYVVMDGAAPYLVTIFGNTQYTTQAGAQAAPLPTTLPPQIDGIAVLVGQVVLQKNDTSVIIQKAGFSSFSSSGSSVTAAGVTTDITNFNNLLSSADTDVQKALDTLDNSAASAATASKTILRDTNANASANNFLQGFTTTATAAGTTTLVVGSTAIQEFTGTSTQTIVLPVVSTLVAGTRFMIINKSTGNLTINSSGGNLVQTLAPNCTSTITCVLITGTTAASWDVEVSIAVTSGNNASIEGYTKLGGATTGTPNIKMKKVTGTTGATEGSATTIAHGLTVGKIISIDVIVFYSASAFVPAHYTQNAGYQFDYDIGSGNINVANHATNSENILSKSVVCTIIYEE